MEGKLYLMDLKKILMDGVIIRKWNDGAGCYEVLFQTHSIEACEIPDILLDMEVCCIGAYFAAWQFIQHGFVLEGMLEINGPHTEIGSDKHEKAYGYVQYSAACVLQPWGCKP